MVEINYVMFDELLWLCLVWYVWYWDCLLGVEIGDDLLKYDDGGRE